MNAQLEKVENQEKIKEELKDIQEKIKKYESQRVEIVENVVDESIQRALKSLISVYKLKAVELERALEGKKEIESIKTLKEESFELPVVSPKVEVKDDIEEEEEQIEESILDFEEEQDEEEQDELEFEEEKENSGFLSKLKNRFLKSKD
ncbi:MAG: hypothetical protein ACK5LM_00865 [Lactovum sp.]